MQTVDYHLDSPQATEKVRIISFLNKNDGIIKIFYCFNLSEVFKIQFCSLKTTLFALN